MMAENTPKKRDPELSDQSRESPDRYSAIADVVREQFLNREAILSTRFENVSAKLASVLRTPQYGSGPKRNFEALPPPR